jgi:hypothetical protein
MRRPTLLSVLLLLASVSAAEAGTSPPGVNLSWDRCFGDGQVKYKTFACNTNVGSETLVATFEVASELPGAYGLDFYMDFRSASAIMPAWWEFKNAGACRISSLSEPSASPPPGSASCAAWADPALVGGGLSTYSVLETDHRYLVGLLAVPIQNLVTLHPGQEYFAFSLTINHLKSIGTGSCAGCLEPVVIYLSSINLYQAGTTGYALRMWNGANYSGSQWVSWQLGYPLDPTFHCTSMSGGGCYHPYWQYDVVPYSATSAHPTSWGLLKSLYR